MENLLFALLGLAAGGGGVYLLIALPLTRKLDTAEKKLKRANRAAEDQSSQQSELQTAQAKLQAMEASYQSQIQGYEQQLAALRQAQTDTATATSEAVNEESRIQELEQSHQNQIEQLRLSYESEKQALVQSYESQLEDLQGRLSGPTVPSQELQQDDTQKGLGLGGLAAGAAGLAGLAGLGAAASGLFQRDGEETAPTETPAIEEESSAFATPVTDEFETPQLPETEEQSETENPFGVAEFETPQPLAVEPETPSLESFGEELIAEEPGIGELGEEPPVGLAEIESESPFHPPAANWIDEDAVTEMPPLPPLDSPLASWGEDAVVTESPESGVLEEEGEIALAWQEPGISTETIENLETLEVPDGEGFDLSTPELEAFADVEDNWVDAPDSPGETLEIPESDDLEGSSRSPMENLRDWEEELQSPLEELQVPESVESLATPEVIESLPTPELAEASDWQEPDFSPFGQSIETSEESSFELSDLELEGNWVDEQPIPTPEVPVLENWLESEPLPAPSIESPESTLENWLESEPLPAPSVESPESTFDISELDLGENWITETPDIPQETSSPSLELDQWPETSEVPVAPPTTEDLPPILEELEEGNEILDLSEDFLADIPSDPGIPEAPGIDVTSDSLDLPEDFLAGLPSEHPNLEPVVEELGTDSDLDFLLNLQAEESDPSPAILSFNDQTEDAEPLPNFVDDELPLLDLFPSEQDDFPELPVSAGTDDSDSQPFINFLDATSEKSDVEFLEMLQNDGQVSPTLADDDLFADLFSPDPVTPENPSSQGAGNPDSDKPLSDDHSFEQLFSEASSLDNWDLPNLDDVSSK